MEFVIGLDLGTTNCKAVALSAQGRILAISSSSHEMLTPQTGWAEQDPRQVWHSAQEALKALVEQNPPGELAGLTLSGAMHSLLLVGSDDEPLAPAMTWADQRAATQAFQLKQRIDAPALYRRTGCPLVQIYHPAKLRWWIERAPELTRKSKLFATIKDYVLHKLCGVWLGDYGMASTMGLLEIHRFTWDNEALEISGVKPHLMPDLLWPSQLAGKLTDAASRLTGLPASLPVVIGTHDGGLANIGAGAAAQGDSVITIGTSGAIRRIVSQPLLDERQRTWCYVLAPDQWLAGGAINNGGLTLQWVREKFYADIPVDNGYAKLLAEAEVIPPGSDGLFLLPYFSGERSPHWDPKARAAILGLRLDHHRAHIARAALEGVAFCLADVWQALVSNQGQEDVLHAHLTGGVTRSPLWAQIIADVLALRLTSVEIADASAVGAAILGHQALGIASISELANKIEKGSLYEPDPQLHRVYADLHRRFQQLYNQIIQPFSLAE
jgi:gluconokinase